MNFIKKHRLPIGILVVLALVAGTVAFMNQEPSGHNNQSEESSVTVEKISSDKKSNSSAKSSSSNSKNSKKSEYGFQLISDKPNPKFPIDLSQYTTSKVQQFRAYDGHEEVNLPMTEGTIKPNKVYTDGLAYWHSSLTVDGKKIPVVASYQRQGYFALYTAEPREKSLDFTYIGQDYNDYIGKDNLDAIANKSN